jgi:glycosyltransferase involved in cell wall biosynthesis
LHFEPGNAIDLASTVQQLLADLPALRRMRHAARQEYEQRYTVEPNYRALMAIYEQVLGGARELKENNGPKTNGPAKSSSKEVLGC